MIRQVLSVGNKIEINEINPKNPEDKRAYISQILGFDEVEEELMTVALPIYEGRLVPLQVGSRYHLNFYCGQGMYLADCVVERRYHEGNIYLMTVRLITPLKKNQRRQYYRMNWYCRMKYKIYNSVEADEFTNTEKTPQSVMDKPYIDATSLDISGGGIRFVGRQEVFRGDYLLTQISLQTDIGVRTFEITSRVVDAVPTKKDPGLYEVRACFLNIAERDREAIIKYIFNEERRKRQSGS